MRLDASGQLIKITVPETVSCTACDGHAERLLSTYQEEGIAYHNYWCCDDACPAAGAIIEHKTDYNHRVGPVFGDRDLAVRLATQVHLDGSTEPGEITP
ncbi:hypothetical protein [Halococcus salifodinae]|uniref:hypothetical protein n=1 Tax=Halococcus salifodinae TaxID=36738 RepID=UPI0009B59A3F|nr:hypothetical protein [Halococcus salifodinae]